MIELPSIGLPPPPEVPPPAQAGVPVRKMARTQMRPWMLLQAKRQGGICPLCLRPLRLDIKGDTVIDHDHESGLIRGVLHRSCNGALGKVDSAAGRWGAKSMQGAAIKEWLRRMLAYYEKPPFPILYPLHKTEDEKRIARNKAARVSRARAKARATVKGKV